MLKNAVEQMIAEFVGTLLFIFIGAGAVVLFGQVVGTGQPVFIAVGLVPIALAHGLGMGVLVSNTGHISGGHHNPAVTIAIWVAGKIEALRALLYIVAQLAGAAAGAYLLSLVIPKRIWDPTHLGATLINKSANLGFTTGKGVALEAILAFILVYTVFATAVDDRGSFKSMAGFPIGFAIGIDILVGGFFTGASMNPARSFGPALVSGTWTDFWVYIVGPITGGILAASLYWGAFLRNRPEPAVDGELEPGEALATEDEATGEATDASPDEQTRIPAEGSEST